MIHSAEGLFNKADFRKKHGLLERAITKQQLEGWLQATREKIGKYPSLSHQAVWEKTSEGNFIAVEGLTWRIIDRALSNGWLQLVNHDGSLIASSLSDFKNKQGFIDQLTERQVVDWILATQEKTGKWPAQQHAIVWQKNDDGTFEVVEGETWASINGAIKTKSWAQTNNDGTHVATSLADLRKKHGFVHKGPITKKENLTEALIVGWIKATQEKNEGRLPREADRIVWQRLADGRFEIVDGVTWGNLSQVLRQGNRGLIKEDGTLIARSLSDLMIKNGFKEERGDLTEDLILGWIEATQEKNAGRLPTKDDKIVWKKLTDGKFEAVNGETWGGLNQALHDGSRGLIKEDGTPLAASLSDFKKMKRLVDAKQPASTRSPVDIETLVDERLDQKLADLADKLMARITDAVRLQGQQAVVTPQDSGITPPHRQSGVAGELQTTTAQEIVEKEITETPPEPAAIVASAPVAIPESIPELASASVQVTMPAAATEVAGTLFGTNFVSRFARFNAPLFEKADAVGDSMFSLLTNAERAFFYGDPIGLKANLRKFAEVFIHRTLLTANGQYLDSLGIFGERRAAGEKIIREYGYICAGVEIAENRGQGADRHAPRLEMADMTRAFRDFMRVLATVQSDMTAHDLNEKVRDIIATGSAIHVQIKARETQSNAQALQNAFDLATWFNGQFCKLVVETAATTSATESSSDAAIEKSVAVEDKSTVVDFPTEATHIEKDTTKPAIAETKISAIDIDDDELPPEIPATVLKTLRVTEDQLIEEIQGSRGADYRPIAEFVAEWAREDAITKTARNRLYARLYAEAAVTVDHMAQQGKNIQEIATALTEQNVGFDVNKQAVKWNANLILRGAVLTSSSLPLEIFALGRDTAVDKRTAATEKHSLKT